MGACRSTTLRLPGKSQHSVLRWPKTLEDSTFARLFGGNQPFGFERLEGENKGENKKMRIEDVVMTNVS